MRRNRNDWPEADIVVDSEKPVSVFPQPTSTLGALPIAGRGCIPVLGMHRSGTSALTRVISLPGAVLPNHLMAPLPDDNEAGFREPRDLWGLHCKATFRERGDHDVAWSFRGFVGPPSLQQ